MALVFTQAHTFPKVQAKGVTDTLQEVEGETLETHWPLGALNDAVADTLGEVKAGALLNALGDTVAEVEAETLYKTLHDIRAETLVEVLHDTLAKNRGGNSWRHTGRSGNEGAARHAGLHASLG